MKFNKYIYFSFLVLIAFLRTASSSDNFTIDFGMSFGSYNGINYSEFNLGTNFFIKPWFSLRNAGFYKNIQDRDSVWGIDSSLRGHLNLEITEASRFYLIGGGGYRFQSMGKSTPFLESNIGIRATRLNIGGGIKYILHSAVDKNRDNEIIYVVNVAL